MKTVFLRVLEEEDKATALLRAIREPERAHGRQRYEVEASALTVIPGSPFAYWLSDSLRKIFSQFPPVEHAERLVRAGLQTGDDFRFVRLWWEVDEKPPVGWFTFVRGGRISTFYCDVDSLLNWRMAGHELKAWATISTGGDHWSKNIRSIELYFRPGLTWPLRAPRFAPYVLPSDSIFSIRGYAYIAPRDQVLTALAVFSSSVFDYLFKVLLGRHDYPEFIVGVLQKLPLPVAPPLTLGDLSGQAWSLKRGLDTRNEISHAFTLPGLLQISGDDLGISAIAWSEHVRGSEARLADIQAEIDDRCFALYDLDDADRHVITAGTRGFEFASSDGTNDAEDTSSPDGNETNTDVQGLAAELVSWTVGVAFGRFDVRVATGAGGMPAEAEPFDPLPRCSPGMLTGDDGRPFAQPPARYPLVLPKTGLLVDDPGQTQDLATAVRAVFDTVFGAGADRWWNDVAMMLDPKRHDIRVWLAGAFFEYHIKRHSKSRRKAPIIWQLATPSGGYSVWLYAHRLTRDSFFQLQNDVVGPKLAHEERQLASRIHNVGKSPSAPERKEIAAHEAVVEELRTMLDEVKRVAPLWNPNLDDGVVLTMAPLWRLVPQHKPWQKELKSKWDELAAGKYDWAHLAMHLWPERVVPKCATDRSLAIAHGLEDEFWVEGADGKWKARETPGKPVDELVRERSSSAVKAALKSLLDAPTSSGTSRARGRRTSRPAATE